MRRCAAIVLVLVTGCAKKQAVAPPTTPPAPQAPKTSPATPPVRARQQPARRPAPPPVKTESPILGEMIPADQRDQLLRDIESALDRARKNVTALQARTPTPDRSRDISRVQTFIAQAQDARSASDLLSARSLAERAQLLSEDLLRGQ